MNGWLAGISDFGEDIVSAAGSASGGVSSHGGSKNDADSDFNTLILRYSWFALTL